MLAVLGDDDLATLGAPPDVDRVALGGLLIQAAGYVERHRCAVRDPEPALPPSVVSVETGQSGQGVCLGPPVVRRKAIPVGAYGPRGMALRCEVDGMAAGRAGEPVDVCPYRPSSRPRETRWWVHGYVAGRLEAGLPTAGDRVDDWNEDAPWPGDES